MADVIKLIAARDKLNADIGTLLGASAVSQASVDSLTAEVTQVDTDVLTAISGSAPPPALDFSAFNAASAAFVADTKLTQAQVDAATAALVAATV